MWGLGLKAQDLSFCTGSKERKNKKAIFSLGCLRFRTPSSASENEVPGSYSNS